ncbi:MAG: penicillin-binding protein [Porphyromonas sp.]|nr:penicillin-binding protein [Porphyromonas sp.]
MSTNPQKSRGGSSERNYRRNAGKEMLSEEEKLAALKQRKRFMKNFYHLYAWLMVLVGFGIIIKALIVTTTERQMWLEKDKIHQQPDISVLPTRGNIYSAMNTAMAVSVPRYKVSVDFKAAGFKDSIFMANVDSMAWYLSNVLGDKSVRQYKDHLLKAYTAGRKGKRRTQRIIPKEISHLEHQQLSQTPYFRIRNKNISGIIEEPVIRRERPYGNMASRTVGFLRSDTDSTGLSHGSSGLELEYDSLLCGVPGISAKKRVSGQWVYPVKKKAVNGCDIHTTIDVNIQDITERALLEKVREFNALWGTAVVMEVETGEIKAMSNLDRKSTGEYNEVVNHALRDLLEPGSTIKVPSVMAVLEDGLASPDDILDVGDGTWLFNKRMVLDHNRHRGGYGDITLAQSIWYSSNVGVAKAVTRGYGNNYKGFRDRLEKMSLLDPISLEIPGTAKPRIREAKNWDKTSIAWISFGYETQIPPIYMLRFYNGIANNGKVMQPYLVRRIVRDDDVLKHTTPTVIRDRMASNKTIQAIQKMLREVVTGGTAKSALSNSVEISGKTGTAYIAEGKSGYGREKNVTFAGYFPSSSPKYSIIVVISRPQTALGAGAVCGPIVKSIAEQIHATTMYRELDDVVPDSLATFRMPIHGGRGDAVERAWEFVIDRKDSEKADGKASNWMKYKKDSLGYSSPQELEIAEERMPSLIGMMPMDAIYLAQKLGLKVHVSDHGAKVVSQSIPAGQRVKPGAQLSIRLH